MTSPRELRLLRIDDDIAPGNPADLPLQHREQMAPAHLQTVFVNSGRQCLAGIRSWASALDFWRDFKPADQIDLIVSDVKFLDDTSPLSRIADSNERIPMPTGLSHFKAFAAIARAKGSALGIGIHTSDASIWAQNCRTGDAKLRFMSLLAAHEIGELAAILGEPLDLADGGAEACWSWLRRLTMNSSDFQKAIPVALREYRRRLAAVKMLPSDWRALSAWCQRMANTAANGMGACLSQQIDCGLPIVDVNGKRDVVSLRSLFADTPLKIRGLDFELEPLPARCFALEADDRFYELDEDGYPRIGSLIRACGSLEGDYAAAIELLTDFPPIASETPQARLTTAKKHRKASPLAVALAVLLGDLRREYTLFSEWKRLYLECQWDAIEDAFVDSHGGEDTLAFYTASVARLLKEGVTLDDVCERLSSIGKDGAKRCLSLLVSMKTAEFSPCDRLYTSGSKTFSRNLVPPFPNPPPANFFDISSLGIAFSSGGKSLNDPSRTMRILFGHDSGQAESVDNAVLSRQIRPAFGMESDPEATAFLDDFREGRAPEWLKALCREFLRDELGWVESEWPQWLPGHCDH